MRLLALLAFQNQVILCHPNLPLLTERLAQRSIPLVGRGGSSYPLGQLLNLCTSVSFSVKWG